MSKSKQDRRSDAETSGLLGDLESIRSLLEEAEDDHRRDQVRPPTGSDDDVPLLEDVVHGGVSLNETFFSGDGDFNDNDGDSPLNDEIFKALLSDDWRDSARALLDQARDAIEQHQTEWTPAHTDELNQALKVRIDETLQRWLRDTLASRVDELRHDLLAALSDEIRVTIDRQFESHEGPDG